MSAKPTYEELEQRVLELEKADVKRKRAEAALRESEERLKFVLDGSQLGFWDWNIETNEVIRNAHWAEMLGYTLAEVEFSVKQWTDLHHPDDRAAAWQSIQDHLEGRTSAHRIEYRMLAKDGHYKWILDQAKIVSRDSQGKPLRMSGTHIDVTERKKAEEALKENEQRYKSAQRIGQVGNWEYDLTTQNFWGSDEAKRIYGFDLESKKFTAAEVENCIPERKRVHQALVDLIEKNKPYDLTFEIRPITGPETKVIKSIAEVVKDPAGLPIKVVGVIQDITKQKEAEKAMIHLERQLRQSQKMESVGRLAGGVAHDFNNMLSIILGHTEMALEQVDPGLPLYADLKEIRTAANRSADLTRQLLAFARKQTIAPQVLDLNETVEGMLKMLRRLIGEDIDLVWLPATNLWPVRMDPSQIDQILANLCVNARDAITDVGRITIETGKAIFDEDYCADHVGFVPGEYVLFTVSDDGSGMTPETLDNLFEPFFTTKDVNKGTGLGLATVYGIVKQNNGFINVYSELEKGTIFRIYLPRYEIETKQIRKKDPVVPDVRGSETILLVEDEPAILKMTTMMLERLGYTVLGAGTPGEAIRLAREHSREIHLLMTDVIMPEMNGRDLARNLLSLYPNLKRLFMSGYTANVIAHHGVLDEGVHFIQKPFARQDLAFKVREVLYETK